jgi:hypothetical protein
MTDTHLLIDSLLNWSAVSFQTNTTKHTFIESSHFIKISPNLLLPSFQQLFTSYSNISVIIQTINGFKHRLLQKFGHN